MNNTINSAIFNRLAKYGFTPASDAVCVGTWNNYAIELQKFAGNLYYVYVAIRTNDTGSVRKTCKDALKAAGVKHASMERVMKNYLLASFRFVKGDEALQGFRSFMDTLTMALAHNGVGPANTCAVTGASNPDSLSLVLKNDYLGYQPVCGSAVRQKDYEVQSRVEENETSGSYASGFLGALIGMLLAVALNVLFIKLTNQMYVVLFALVPIAAMFGYKLFKGKTNKNSLIIIVLLSLLSIPLIIYLIATVTLMHDFFLPLGEALSEAGKISVNPEYLSAIRRDLIMMVLFMALGLLFAWRFIRGQLNSTKSETSKILINTMRPNPVYGANAAAAEAPQTDNDTSFH